MKRVPSVQRRLELYAERQRSFWNTRNEETARFERIVTDGPRSEADWAASTSDAVENIFGQIAPEADWTILEIGCGIGRIVSEFLARNLPFRLLIGVDISEAMIQFARKRIGETPRARFLVNDGYSLRGVEDVSVDFVYSNDMFIHLFDADAALSYFREVRRVLAANGLFRFNVRVFDPDTAFTGTLGGRWARWLYRTGILSTARHRWAPREDAEFNGNQYTPQDLRRLVERSGLRVEIIEPRESHLWCTARKLTP